MNQLDAVNVLDCFNDLFAVFTETELTVMSRMM